MEGVARWMAHVGGEYDLLGILPLITSCVEPTAAWIGPGDVKTVWVHSNAVNHESSGHGQSKVGTYEGCAVITAARR